MEIANLTCPKCGHAQKMEIPQDMCVPFYECQKCGEMISVPDDSGSCCVVCAYSDKKCPTQRA